ncbi:MAG: tripartite tricarboxylate transporter substrate binding protein [bacterium]
MTRYSRKGHPVQRATTRAISRKSAGTAGAPLGAALCALCAMLAPAAVSAQAEFPVKPIRILVPLAPGGGNDAVARMVGTRLQERLGQPILVDTRPGAGGVVGTEIAARAAPDGYTMIVVNNSHVIMGDLYSKLSFDPMRDFTPISLAASSPLMVVVHPSLPVNNITELLAWTRANPGKMNYGTSGVGSPPHLAGELLSQMGKADMTAIVFKGIGPAVAAVMGNEIPMTLPNLIIGMPQVKAGRVRALAITSLKRSESAPDLPTVAESGLPGYEAAIWFGFLAPRGVAAPIVDRLNREIVNVLRLPEVRQQIAGIGADPIASTPAEFAAVMKSDAERLGRLIRERNIRAN